MSAELKDKTILITGGLGAVAEHILKALSAAGATLVVTDAFLYLCSHLADEVDGHVLQVDMGVGLPKLG